MARTMYRVRKGDFQCFLPNETLARVARRTFPELKGGQILNILQMIPGSKAFHEFWQDWGPGIIPGRLIEGQGSARTYRPDKANLQARCVGL